MSFFKDLKEDIVQSVNELSDSLEEKVTEEEENEVNEVNEANEAIEEEVQKEMDSLLENESLFSNMTAEEEAAESEDEEIEEEIEEEIKQEEKDSEKKVVEDYKEEIREERTVATFDDEELRNGDDTTVITKGTTINGGIKSDTSLLVHGVIEGDVECQGKLTIMGRVAGNSTASEIYVNTARLEGNLSSRGSVKIDVGTVVIGSVSSASVVVAGAIKGDIDVNGPVIVDSTAVVKGSIYAKSIQVNSGAVIDGNCSLKYADVDLDAFFE